MLQNTNGIHSILEYGSNIGRNIELLNRLLPQADMSNVEISLLAFKIVTKRFSISQSFNGSILDPDLVASFDLVFCMGVLIHIHPDDLYVSMKKMLTYSSKYILFGAYFNPTPTKIEYQGTRNRFFKSDFSRLFAKSFHVLLVDYGFHWEYLYNPAGFKDIAWLFEKK